MYTPYGPIQGDHVMWWVIHLKKRKNTHLVWTRTGRPRNVVGDVFKKKKGASVATQNGKVPMWSMSAESKQLLKYPEWNRCYPSNGNQNYVISPAWHH
jgi:hypothetical protein